MKSNEDIVRCRWRLQIIDHRIERCILTFGSAKIKWCASDQRHGHRRLGFVPLSPVCVSSHRIPGKSPPIGASVPTRLITWDFEDLDIKLDGYFDRCTRRAWGERCQRFVLLLQYAKLMIHSPRFCNTSNGWHILPLLLQYVKLFAPSKRHIRHICVLQAQASHTSYMYICVLQAHETHEGYVGVSIVSRIANNKICWSQLAYWNFCWV